MLIQFKFMRVCGKYWNEPVLNQCLAVMIRCLLIQVPHLPLFCPGLLPDSPLACIWHFPFSVGVIMRHHSRADEDRDWVADAVQTEGGPGPHQSRGPPQASDLLVHRRDCPIVFHRCRTGHDAQELLRGEERFCCSHYIELCSSRKMKAFHRNVILPLLHRSIFYVWPWNV